MSEMPGIPLASEKFLAPASCKHKSGDDAFLKEQNADRERTVCAVGLDVHYELNVVANEPGAHTPRLKHFNPRMSSAACPYNYTGKFVEEAEFVRNQDDPISLGRVIEKKKPYDPPLYAKRDPRLISKTVVVRDYGCKVPIDIADTEKIARAVLNHYPDQYVAFLGEFVSNLFGASMRKFLDTQIAGYQKMLENPQELNRVSWGAYRSVQGGVDTSGNIRTIVQGVNAYSTVFADAPDIPDEVKKNLPTTPNDYDVTLPWNAAMSEQLQQLTREGLAMTGQITSQDIFDVRKCIDQHLETLKEMRGEWCRGFGTKEEHVLAMLCYANDQGRNLCADLRLMAKQDMPDYELIRLHTPVNFYHIKEDKPTNTINNPDENASIRSRLVEPARNVGATPSILYPVGNWCGSADTSNVFLGTGARAPYLWGWGHAANVAIRGRDFGDGENLVKYAPYLAYEKADSDKINIKRAVSGIAYVKDDRWGKALTAPGADAGRLDKVIPTAQERKGTGLRDSLLDEATHPFRGIMNPPDSASEDPSFYAPVDRDYITIPTRTACVGDVKFSPFDPKITAACQHLDPFLVHGGECFDVSSGTLKFPSKMLAPYSVKDMASSPIFHRIVSRIADSAASSVFGEGENEANVQWATSVMQTMVGSDTWPYVILGTTSAVRDAGMSGYVSKTPYSKEALTEVLEKRNDQFSIGVANIGNVKFESPYTSIQMTDVVASQSQKLALQILMFRKTMQYTFGMDLAYILCREVFFKTDRRSVVSIQQRPYADRNHYNELFTEAGLTERWSVVIDKVVLKTANGDDVSRRRRDELIHKVSLAKMLQRLKAFVNKDVEKIKTLVSTARETLRDVSPTTKAYTNYAGYDEDIPSEWLFQYRENVSDQDPRLLYAGTPREYDRQRNTSILSTEGAVNAAFIADISEKLYEVFAKALKRPGVSGLLDQFLALRDDPPERKFKGVKYRASAGPVATAKFVELDDNEKFPYTDVGIKGDIDKVYDRAPQTLDSDNFSLLPLGTMDAAARSLWENRVNSEAAEYNANLKRGQLFSMLDASALLWNARSFFNPADANRPHDSEDGNQDDMHYWCRTYVESFLCARELHKLKGKDLWEIAVKTAPGDAFPTKCIGSMCDETFATLFPLIPNNHSLRDNLRRVRALNVMWGTLPSYACGNTVRPGAWMPLSEAHRVRLLRWVTSTYQIPMFDETYRVPANPWLAHNGQGISRVYNQSYHSVYYTDSYRAPHFREWVTHACRYQPPRMGENSCYYPFSQYGGTPVEGDFLPHRVEAPHKSTDPKRHAQLMYNRFGFTAPLRIGQQFLDTGLLQDLFRFEYRPFAALSYEQRQMPPATAVYPSNFLAYARTHAIVALASCNQGTEEASVPRIVRNLYRLYVDTYECMGANPDDDGVPVVMGFLPQAVNRKEDRPVVMYAGSLACINSKLERFCASGANRGERVCQMYKQVYLNDATLLFTRLLRAERRKKMHDGNFQKALLKRGQSYTRKRFDDDLIDLQDAYIDFLQTTILGMLIESGANLNNVPLHLLEPRELEVSMYAEDTDIVGNDYLTPRTRELVKDMDFGADSLSRTQMAILSLIPPNNRILGTMRLNQSTQVVDLEHVKKQIQKTTIENNKKVWDKYMEAVVDASLATRFLETDGPIDFGFDMSAIKDPLKESEGIATKVSTTNAQASSSLSQSMRADTLRMGTGPDSVLGMNTQEMARALQAVRERVERDYAKNGGNVPRVKCLALLKIPEHVKRMLRPEYE